MISITPSIDHKPLRILIVDKQGDIGYGLVNSLTHADIVLLCKTQRHTMAQKLLYTPYATKIPQIPDYTYTHIFLIYDGEQDLLGLFPEFLEKARKDNARITILIPLSYISEQLVHDVVASYKGVSLIVHGDMFGEGVHANHSLINVYFAQARHAGKINIPGLGLHKTYPVYVEDAVSRILHVAFEKTITKQRLFYLFPPHPPTQLTLAHMMQKIDPLLRVDFTKEDIEEIHPAQIQFIHANNGENLLENRYPLSQRIKESKKLEDIGKVSLKDKQKEHPVSRGHQNHTSSLIKWMLYSIIASGMVPVLVLILSGLNGFYMLYSARSAFENGNPIALHSVARNAEISFAISNKALSILEFELSLVGKEKKVDVVSKRIQAGIDISHAFVHIAQGWKGILSVSSGKSSNPRDDFISSLNSIKNAVVHVQKAQIDLSSYSKNDIFSYSEQARSYEDLLSRANNLDTLISLFTNTMDVASSLVGMEEKKTYLVLFQNNMELRPSGGFIGSYGLLKLHKGKVEEFKIHDVYDADGQLKGHIEPPFAIRRYLPSVHLYLRDSNFDIDFPKAASRSAFILNQETGEVVDGVIAVDMSLIKSILKATGPVYVSDYKETITAENVYLITQAHVEKNFFPGSTQKKDFLHSLYNTIILTLQSRKKISYIALAESLNIALSQKHILFAFPDPNIQNIFTVNGFSSSLWDDRKTQNYTVNDFLSINEANLGVNKANYFISRKVLYDVFVDKSKNSILSRVTVKYKNTSSTWPGGEYKNYLRLVIPRGSTIVSISFDGKEQQLTEAITNPLIYERKGFVVPAALEVEHTSEADKDSIGFLVTVPAGLSKTVSIAYTLPSNMFHEDPIFIYNLRVLKQPGTDTDPFSFSFTYPSTMKVTKKSSTMENREDRVLFLENLAKDIDLSMQLSKK